MKYTIQSITEITNLLVEIYEVEATSLENAIDLIKINSNKALVIGYHTAEEYHCKKPKYSEIIKDKE